VFDRLFALTRRARSRLQRWSRDADRDFHDAAFSQRAYDPFSASYPGFLTIRRFAELAAPHLTGTRLVVDLGCGPAEITGELARRFPSAHFVGVDHSAAAIAQARENASRLQLTNIEFAVADVETFDPPAGADIILMFDSFHHLIDPARFVQRIRVDRFFLVEPAGDRLGGWRRSDEFDWLPQELDKVRARIEHALGDGSIAPATPASLTAGRAIEHRYPLEDYQRFFSAFDLTVHGTIFGFDAYPPQPAYESPWRARLMATSYELLSEIESKMIDRGRDLDAKHWTIFAQRAAGPGRLVRPERASLDRPARPDPEGLARITGQFDAAYRDPVIPSSIRAREIVHAEVTVENRSWRAWRSDATATPVHLSYHWLDSRGRVVVSDGVRTPLPRAIEPGETATVAFRVEAPGSPAQYILEIDLVEESVSWFTAAGVVGLRLRIAVV
jgi:SAM-dependent methyltransferase